MEEVHGNFVQLVWKDTFNCGNPLIDGQHQKLFHTSNELFDAVLSGRPAPEISAVIAVLLDDVSKHFRDEQTILESTAFPGFSHHVAEHAELLTKGLKLSEQFDASTLAVGDVFQYLVNDVVMIHMFGADREYFPYIGGNAESGST